MKFIQTITTVVKIHERKMRSCHEYSKKLLLQWYNKKKTGSREAVNDSRLIIKMTMIFIVV